MTDELVLKTVFASILSRNGVMAPLERLEFEGLRDEPGFHWSNPVVKLVSAHAGGKRYPFVLKRLGEHSKREVLVYRFLSGKEGFPLPRLFHEEYDDDRKKYWLVIERCVGRDFTRPEDFWEQCGLLLARIHAAFWDKTYTLPDFFHTDEETEQLRKAVDRTSGFLKSLKTEETETLEKELGLSLSSLRSTLDGVNRERLPKPPESSRCLLHGSFHPPEIMWRETSGKYTPLGVDWERSRAGIPAVDLAFGINNPLAKGEKDLFGILLDTYLSELKAHGITPSRNNVLASVRHEALVHMMGKEIPFVWGTYLKVRNQEGFADWCRWVRQSALDSLRALQDEIKSGRIYGE